MKCIPWISVATVVFAFFAVLLGHETMVAKTSGETSLISSSAELANGNDLGVPQAPEDKFAWEEFAALVHPTEAGPPSETKKSTETKSTEKKYREKKHLRPEWITWYSKCRAGLTAACPTPTPTPTLTSSVTPIPPPSPTPCLEKSAPDETSPDKPDPDKPCPDEFISANQSATEIPRQLVGDFNKLSPEQQDQFVQHFSRAPQLDAVLFNPVAADSIRRSNLGRASSLELAIQQLDMQNFSGADRRLPPGTFAFGSEIVKLIWEIIPDDSDKALPIYDPQNPTVLEHSLQLAPQAGWRTSYKIKVKDETKKKDAIKEDEIKEDKTCRGLPPFNSDNPPAVSVKCFYSFTITIDNNSPASCHDLGVDIQRTFCISIAAKKTFRVFLMGFHVMKLTPGNPDWIWSTYYWTRDTNEKESGKVWNAPWNHFHQFTTTAIRENAGDHAICFNPYLEGIEANGLKANCLSCHSFAAYAPNVAKLSSGVTDGKKYPYPKAARLQDEQDHFRGAVQTSFIWSISTSQGSPGSGQDPVPFQKKLEKALQEQFQTK